MNFWSVLSEMLRMTKIITRKGIERNLQVELFLTRKGMCLKMQSH